MDACHRWSSDVGNRVTSYRRNFDGLRAVDTLNRVRAKARSGVRLARLPAYGFCAPIFCAVACRISMNLRTVGDR
jgi:hypothetical protein